MSKFFFKGRKDARQSHINHGYQSKALVKAGSKKQPLKLRVTSEERQQEVAAMLAEANLHGEIALDASDGAMEDIAELTVLLKTPGTQVLAKPPARNEPCHCGSGKKYKKCCAAA